MQAAGATVADRRTWSFRLAAAPVAAASAASRDPLLRNAFSVASLVPGFSRRALEAAPSDR